LQHMTVTAAAGGGGSSSCKAAKKRRVGGMGATHIHAEQSAAQGRARQLACLGGVDEGLARVHVLAVVVIHNIKRTLRVRRVVNRASPVHLEPTDAAILAVRGLGGQLGLQVAALKKQQQQQWHRNVLSAV
jgi:hypothetical protein